MRPDGPVRRGLPHAPRVAGPVFLGSPAGLADKSGVVALLEWIDGLADPIDPAVFRPLLGSLVSRPLPAEFAGLMAAEGARVPAQVWQDTFRGLLAEPPPVGLDSVTAPVLPVWGDPARVAAEVAAFAEDCVRCGWRSVKGRRAACAAGVVARHGRRTSGHV